LHINHSSGSSKSERDVIHAAAGHTTSSNKMKKGVAVREVQRMKLVQQVGL
jgi:hypothetical protein